MQHYIIVVVKCEEEGGWRGPETDGDDVDGSAGHRLAAAALSGGVEADINLELLQ